MTILAIAQTCSTRLKLLKPATFFGSTNNDMVLLKTMLEKTGEEIRDLYPWPELSQDYNFTLVTGQATYALPPDFNSMAFETAWNRDQRWPLIGPLTAVEYQTYKNGLLTSVPRQRFRVRGWTTNQITIDPVPTSADNGQVCVFEYFTKTLFRPKTWIASTSWAGNNYCSYNGNIYLKASGSSTGTTPPTHTSGSVSDGGISWTYTRQPQETILHDEDEPLLDKIAMTDGAVWRHKQENGLDFGALMKFANDQLDLKMSNLEGASVLSVSRAGLGYPMIGERNYPEQDF